jgi:hypothetical protein
MKLTTTRDGIRAVDGAGAFLEHFDTLDQVQRDQVHVDARREPAEDADAAAVQQHERAVGAETAQLDVGLTGAAAVVDLRIGRRARDRRNPRSRSPSVETPED